MLLPRLSPLSSYSCCCRYTGTGARVEAKSHLPTSRGRSPLEIHQTSARLRHGFHAKSRNDARRHRNSARLRQCSARPRLPINAIDSANRCHFEVLKRARLLPRRLHTTSFHFAFGRGDARMRPYSMKLYDCLSMRSCHDIEAGRKRYRRRP